MFNIVKKEINWSGKNLSIETGKIARQATSSIIVAIDNLVVLTTMVARKEADPKKDFFPLHTRGSMKKVTFVFDTLFSFLIAVTVFSSYEVVTELNNPAVYSLLTMLCILWWRVALSVIGQLLAAE